ncbi:MAG: hypothetical protein WBR24_09035, partial [Desulfobacterales bacterium]
APDYGLSTRHIHLRISGYAWMDVTQQTGHKTSKWWNYFLPGPLSEKTGSNDNFLNDNKWFGYP